MGGSRCYELNIDVRICTHCMVRLRGLALVAAAICLSVLPVADASDLRAGQRVLMDVRRSGGGGGGHTVTNSSNSSHGDDHHGCSHGKSVWYDHENDYLFVENCILIALIIITLLFETLEEM